MYIAIAIFCLYAGALCADLYKECIHQKPITMADYHQRVLDVHLKQNNIPAACSTLADKMKELERRSYVQAIVAGMESPQLKKIVEKHLSIAWRELCNNKPSGNDTPETIRDFFNQLNVVEQTIKNSIEIGRVKLNIHDEIKLHERKRLT